MGLGVFFALLIAGTMALLLLERRRARERRRVLEQSGRVSTWEQLEREPSGVTQIVQADFGYGAEVWAFRGDVSRVKLGHRAFESGVLIVPRPKLAVLQEFCQLHAIAFVTMAVKYAKEEKRSFSEK